MDKNKKRIYGTRIIPDLLAVLVVSCLYVVICYMSFGSKIPFAEPLNEVGEAPGLKTFLLLLPVAVLAGVHYLMASHLEYGAIIHLFVLIVINFAVWKIVFRRVK